MLLAAQAATATMPVRLTEKQLSDAYGIPMNEQESALAAKGEPTDFIVFPRKFKVTACRSVEMAIECEFKIKWPRGGWHPKHGRFLKRVDGTWIADEASQEALYEK